MSEQNPFAQDVSIRSRHETDQTEAKLLRSRSKNIDDSIIKRVDKVAVEVGWATDDEVKNGVASGKASEQLGVRVCKTYASFVKEMCSTRRQTKRVIIEEALEAYCEKHGLPSIL